MPRFSILIPIIGNLKPVLSFAEGSKLKLGGLLLSLSYSPLAEREHKRNRRNSPDRIFVGPSPLPLTPPGQQALRPGLRDLGHLEGKNLVIESRCAEGKPDREPELAAELARLNVDVIVTAGITMDP